MSLSVKIRERVARECVRKGRVLVYCLIDQCVRDGGGVVGVGDRHSGGIVTDTESSLSPVDPPLSCSVVIVTTLFAAVVW